MHSELKRKAEEFLLTLDFGEGQGVGVRVIMEWGVREVDQREQGERFGSSNGCEAVKIEGNYATMCNT